MIKKILTTLCLLLTLNLYSQDYKIKWEKVSGNGNVTFENSSDPKTKISVSEAGQYVLRITVESGSQKTFKDITVFVNYPEVPVIKPDPILPPPLPSKQGITYPIEVLGENQHIVSSKFVLNNPSAFNEIYFKTHNITYDDKMEFSINNGSWIKVKESQVNMRKMDHIAGGFGGGHTVIAFTMSHSGNLNKDNEIRFKFNSRPKEVSSGYRVLNYNFKNNGVELIQKNQFVEDDPKYWTPYYTDNAKLQEGKNLWLTAKLTDPMFPAGYILKASCSDCHAEDGRDLKYFNYSNKSIVARSTFHGLSEEQGKLIASYIRSLPYNSKFARPWNPPYQPAKGLDARGVNEWAAGGGEESVLDSFEDMYPYMFPEAIDNNGQFNKSLVTGKSYDINKPINMREIPIPNQFPDWNGWLPIVHPKDSTGDFFTNHAAYRKYVSMKSKPNRVADHNDWFFYQNDVSNFTKIDNWPNYPATGSHNLNATPQHSMETYSVALWAMTKAWEVIQDKDLESYAYEYFSKITPIAEGPSWFTNMPFFTSVNMLGLPMENFGVKDGSKVTRFYLAHIWYHVQAVLYAGQGVGYPIRPLDWPYVYGFIQNMPFGLDYSKHEVKPMPLFFVWMMKMTQMQNNGKMPNNHFDSSPQFNLSFAKHFIGAPSIEKYYFSDQFMYNKMVEVQINYWLDLVSRYTPEQVRLDDRFGKVVGFSFPKGNQGAINNLYYNESMIQQIFYVGHKLKQINANPQLIARMQSVLQPIFNQAGIPWNEFGK